VQTVDSKAEFAKFCIDSFIHNVR